RPHAGAAARAMGALGRRAGGAAIRTAAGLIGKALAGVELLLPRSKDELRAAIATGQRLVGVNAHDLLLWRNLDSWLNRTPPGVEAGGGLTRQKGIFRRRRPPTTVT